MKRSDLMNKLVVACLVLFGVLGGLAVGIIGVSKVPALANFAMPTVDKSAQVVDAVVLEEQVTLVSMFIKDFEESSRPKSEILGVPVIGTERKSILWYSFTAKLGLEGKDVRITTLSEHHYQINVPRFIFTGYDKIPFDQAFETNGPLSWMTESIDPRELDKKLLSEEYQAQYLSMQKSNLEQQAEVFYSRIILSIDPEAVIDFSYAS